MKDFILFYFLGGVTHLRLSAKISVSLYQFSLNCPLERNYAFEKIVQTSAYIYTFLNVMYCQANFIQRGS